MLPYHVQGKPREIETVGEEKSRVVQEKMEDSRQYAETNWTEVREAYTQQ